MKSVRTVVISKAPIAGFAKTRLIPALGTNGAVQLARKMLLHTLNTALGAQLGPVELCAAPAPEAAIWQNLSLPTGVSWSAQGEGDLGARMARPAQRAIARGEAVLLIGTDCPAITRQLLREASYALTEHNACMVPTFDGGYALLGLKHFDHSLFDAMPWSTDAVAEQTLRRLKTLDWRVKIHPRLHDIDEPADLQWLPLDWGFDQAGAKSAK